jgi:alkanesulfonate monooxygenase
MPIEFIGSLVSASPGASPSAWGVRSGLESDPEYPSRIAALHEESGFDRVLVEASPGSPDAFIVANQVLTTTSRLGVLVAQRPGLVAPTVAARQYATLEAFHRGRVAMHVTMGSGDAGLLGDADPGTGRARYRRADEFLEVVKRTWSSCEPFDYGGEFYRVAGAMSAVRPSAGALPIYVAGGSGEAAETGGKHADVYALWDEPLTAMAERIAEVRAVAGRHRRSPRFSVSVRLIAAPTQDAARNRADRILGAQRAGRARAASQDALVGSYEQVAMALVAHVAAGASSLLINGYDPQADAADHAAVIRLVRERVQDGRCLVA